MVIPYGGGLCESILKRMDERSLKANLPSSRRMDERALKHNRTTATRNYDPQMRTDQFKEMGTDPVKCVAKQGQNSRRQVTVEYNGQLTETLLNITKAIDQDKVSDRLTSLFKMDTIQKELKQVHGQQRYKKVELPAGQVALVQVPSELNNI